MLGIVVVVVKPFCSTVNYFIPICDIVTPRIIDIYLYSRFDKIIDLFAVPLALPVVFAALEDCLKTLYFLITGPTSEKTASAAK